MTSFLILAAFALVVGGGSGLYFALKERAEALREDEEWERNQPTAQPAGEVPPVPRA